jgi:phosphoglycolate phosphatase
MPGYRLAIFDFDGTLADSLPFFLSIFNEQAARHGFRPIDPTEVPALRHLDARRMMRHVGLPAWKLPTVAASFIEAMRRQNGQIRPFAGMEESLARLAGADLPLAVVTSNARDNVQRILGEATMARLVHLDCGMSIFGKASRLRKTLKATGVAGHQAIYIGDQLTDLEAARSAGLAFGAVGWGYGTLESLRNGRPDEVFEEFADLLRLV